MNYAWHFSQSETEDYLEWIFSKITDFIPYYIVENILMHIPFYMQELGAQLTGFSHLIYTDP